MPALSRWLIHLALVYLVLSLLLGVVMAGGPLLGWILPRLAALRPRGNQSLACLAFLLINLGIWLVVTQHIFLDRRLSLVGRLVEAFGAALFLVAVWPRIKPLGRSGRE